VEILLLLGLVAWLEGHLVHPRGQHHALVRENWLQAFDAQ